MQAKLFGSLTTTLGFATAFVTLTLLATPAVAQEGSTAKPAKEDLESAQQKALDSTATQWSFQFSYQAMPDYHQDTLDNGETRPAGATDYIQARIVAPVPLKSLTILPRLTFRHYENAKGQFGLGNTELFALIIPNALNWGSGRAGVGPLVTFPGNKDVARDEWGYGFAAAVVNGSGPWFYGLLFTQSWQSIDPTALPPGKSDTNPLGIAPFLNFQFGAGGTSETGTWSLSTTGTPTSSTFRSAFASARSSSKRRGAGISTGNTRRA